ncbi:ATP-dependent DNA helicase [Mycoplasma mobile 163K]|uniref:DNA 3'-5' helicase n=2 Tax=[Mycoplasma] mobile TaxID=2118 RepID=Q6KHF3_MYCM1|nr:ATP-dependent DNA helicase [Mycoplasma mobile 163K]
MKRTYMKKSNNELNEEPRIEDKLLEGLNDIQKSIVTLNSKTSSKVLASAGSGKTKVLTRRYAYLSSVLGIDYEKILVITLNEHSVDEMKNRISRFFSFDFEKTTNIHTFYTFCGKILREDIDKLGLPNDFILTDNTDKKQVLQQIFRHKNLKEGTVKLDEIFAFISANKIKNISPKDSYNEAKNDLIKLKAEFYMSYEKYLEKNKSIDYEDLVTKTFELLSEFPEIRKKWSQYFSYILIDEFQDLGFQEYEILKKIAMKTPIMIVGDTNQTIFSPKYTDVKYMSKFHEDFPNVQIFHLNKNYRSNKSIIEAVNNLMKKNNTSFESSIKEMEAQNLEEEKIVYQQAFSTDAEARWVVHKINKLKRNKVQLKDIAIFYRSSFYTKSFEDELEKAEINFQILDDNKFYERDEIKDCISFLRVLHDGSSTTFLRILNVPNRDVSVTFEKKLLEYAESRNENIYDALINLFKDTKKEVTSKMKLQWNTKNKTILLNLVNLINSFRKYRNALKKYPIYKSLHGFLEEVKYYDYLKDDDAGSDKEKNILELLNSIKIWENANRNKNLADYLEEISLISSKYKSPLSKNSVSLISAIHSKGTQFKNVFIVGLSEYIWPNIKSIEELEKTGSSDLIDNERRLFYIALTRAVDRIFLSDSQGFFNSDLKYKKSPSRFLNEIGIDLQQFTSNLSVDPNVNQESELEIGFIVMHDIFGEGTIMDINDDTVTIAFRHPHEAKTIRKNHPSLKKVN